MRRNRRERGEGQAGCIFGLVVLLIGIFAAYKLIPVKVKAAEMRDIVTDEARSAGAHNDTQIMKAILQKAQDLKLPVAEEDVKIERRSNEIFIDVEYVVPVEFPGFTYKWKFHHKEQNPIF